MVFPANLIRVDILAAVFEEGSGMPVDKLAKASSVLTICDGAVLNKIVLL